MATIIILSLVGLLFVAAYAILGLMDEVRVRDEALDWLYDNGHMTEKAAMHVTRMIDLPHE